jgi:hypothetical protein
MKTFWSHVAHIFNVNVDRTHGMAMGDLNLMRFGTSKVLVAVLEFSPVFLPHCLQDHTT